MSAPVGAIGISFGSRRRVPIVVAIALGFLAAVAVAVVAGPVVFSGATQQDILSSGLPAGSPGHPLGTDEIGRAHV